MNARQIEVHEYYKSLYADALVLYRLPGRYMVLGENVDRAQNYIPNIDIQEPGVAVVPDDIRSVSALGADGTEVRIIQYRNDGGVFDLPDVKRLKEEKDVDF